jgi:hypothetical protein
MWVNKLLPHTCLLYSFCGLLIYPWFVVWLSCMFLLEQLLVGAHHVVQQDAAF